MKSTLLAFFVMFALIKGYSQEAYVETGNYHYYKKDYKSALPYFFLALREYKSDPDLLFKIGMSYLNMEDKGQAISFLEKAYKINPEVDSEILFHMGLAYQSSLKYAKAKICYEEFKREHPKNNVKRLITK